MINYGVIGCGGISKVHCPGIQKQKESRLHTVCDIIPERADALAKEFACNAVYNYDDVLQNDEIDVITICLPHHEHYELFKKALAAGKHVISEKPLAINMENLVEMVKLSETTSLKTTVAFQHRHSELIIALKEYLDSGLIGEIESAQLDFYCTRDMDYYNADSWRGKWATEGGGLLINQAIHTIDLANLFLGKPIKVTGNIKNLLHPEIEVEDYALGDVKYSNCLLKIKAVNSKEKNWEPKITLNGSKGQLVILGSDKIISLDLIDEDCTEIKDNLKKIEKSMIIDKDLPGKTCYGDLHERIFDNFTHSILDNKAPLVSIKDGAMANEIVLGFYKNREDK